MRDLYEILQVRRDAAEDEIRSAYRRLARECHPDLNGGDPEAEEAFKAVGIAYAVLSDPKTRALYDVYGDPGLYDAMAGSTLTPAEIVRAASELVKKERQRKGATGRRAAEVGEAAAAAAEAAQAPSARRPSAPERPPSRLDRAFRALRAGSLRVRDILSRRVAAWSVEPARPLAARMERVATAAERMGEGWLRSVGRIEVALAAHAQQLHRTAETFVRRPAPPSQQATERQLLSGLQGGLLALGSLLGALFLGYLNAWALAARIPQIAAAHPTLPWAEGLVDVAWTIAFTMTATAVGAGILSRALAEFHREESAGVLVDMAPGLFLLCLAAIQAGAFSGIAVELGAGAVLPEVDATVDPEDVAAGGASGGGVQIRGLTLLGGFVGGSIVLLLAALGYALWTGIRAVLLARAQMLTATQLRTARQRFEDLDAEAARARERLREIEARVSTLADDLGREFAVRAGVDQVGSVAKTLRSFVHRRLDPAGGVDDEAATPCRTPTEAVAALVVDLLLLAAGALCAFVVVSIVGAAVPAALQTARGGELAAALLAALVVGAFFARDLRDGAAFANPVLDLVRTRAARRSIATVGAATALATIVLVALAGALLASPDASRTVAALAAAAPAAAVALVSIRLDRCLVSLGRVLWTAPLVAVWVILELATLLVRLALPLASSGARSGRRRSRSG